MWGVKMIVYIDLLLIENIIVNYFVISITCKTVNLKYSYILNILAAIVGSLSCVIVIFFNLNNMSQILLKLFTSIAMVMIICLKNCFKRIKEILKLLLVMYLYSMVLGGVCLFLIYNKEGAIVSSSYTMSLPYKKLFLAIILVYLFVDRIFIYIKNRISLKQLLYKIRINIKGCEIEVKGFLDTGNELIEPATNLPVIIVEKTLFKDLVIESNEKYLVPYRVVDGTEGYLEGVQARYIQIDFRGHLEKKNAIVVFTNNKLSVLGEYRAILSKQFLI